MHLEGRIHKGFDFLRKEIVRLKERKEIVKKISDDLIRKSKKERDGDSQSKTDLRKKKSKERKRDKSEDKHHKHRHEKMYTKCTFKHPSAIFSFPYISLPPYLSFCLSFFAAFFLSEDAQCNLKICPTSNLKLPQPEICAI